MNTLLKLMLICLGTCALSACTTAKVAGKVASLPFKAVYKTGEMAGKGVYFTGKTAGKGVYLTGKTAGKGTYLVGKGVYNTAKVPVKITNAALDTSVKVLTVSTKVVDLTGKVVTVSRTLQRSEVDAYVAQARGASNVIGILVDIARGA